MKNRFTKLKSKFKNTKIYNHAHKMVQYLKTKFEKSIRFELMVVVGVCFVASFLFYGVANNLLKTTKEYSDIEYNYDYINYNGNYINEQINDNPDLKIDDSQYFYQIFNELRGNSKGYITDIDGKVIYKSDNAIETSIDIFTVMKNNAEIGTESRGSAAVEKMFLFPVNLGEERYFFVYAEVPTAQLKTETYVEENSFLALILSVVAFITVFLIITNKKMLYLDEIAYGLKNIAEGELSYRIEEKGNDEISNLAININHMASEISNKIEAEKAAEQTKADLITNVSHDLRTPLTSIMGYIGLVKDGRYKDDEEMKQYLNISFTKAEKLKLLIEDLFEYTKLNNNGAKLAKADINIVEFLAQLIDELTPLFDENNLEVISTLREEKIFVNVDTNKMLRVFENLLTNAIKYSYKPGSVIVGLYENNGSVTVSIKNKGEHISQEKLSKLFDRFYRVDESRNAQSGGSGLGLAISKNIVELHGGKIWAECYGNDINFYVRLKVVRKK